MKSRKLEGNLKKYLFWVIKWTFLQLILTRCSVDVINKVDLVVVFRDIVNKYEKNCQTGQWNSPFCRQTQLSNQLIADMEAAADFEPSKFVSMIFQVNSDDLSGLIKKHFQGDFPGGLFVSDKLYADATGKPSFFDKLSDITGTYTTGMKVRTGNCGCNDILNSVYGAFKN